MRSRKSGRMESETIELAEAEVDRLIAVCHKSLNYWQILRIFLNACIKLQMQADCEYFLKANKPL